MPATATCQPQVGCPARPGRLAAPAPHGEELIGRAAAQPFPAGRMIHVLKWSEGRSGAGCRSQSRVAEPAPGRRDDPPKHDALPERTHGPMTTRRLLLAAPALLLPLAARAQ